MLAGVFRRFGVTNFPPAPQRVSMAKHIPTLLDTPGATNQGVTPNHLRFLPYPY